MHKKTEQRNMSNGENITSCRDASTMGKEERMRLVLEILDESQLALPPAVIFRNLKVRGATFERRSVNNYLEELSEQGYLRKVDPKHMEEGGYETVGPDETGYYIITEEGSEHVSD
jgi:repressor of nif and glnA expression